VLEAQACNLSYSGGRDRSRGLQFEASPRQIVLETLSQKKKKSQKRAGVGPEFKPQNCKKKKKDE
jgi:hypothetical protein